MHSTTGRSPCGERGLKYASSLFRSSGNKSLPVRGAWVEIPSIYNYAYIPDCRSPCGERGLKLQMLLTLGRQLTRRSPCGERGLKCREYLGTTATLSGRSPCGERGLKSVQSFPAARTKRRSPCGERGLKCLHAPRAHDSKNSRSPCGERGLKFHPARWQRAQALVAPRAGSVG